MPIRNVLMYVCDALRWDMLPQEIDERGVTFKTVAQSTWSPPCFTTLSTGVYPEHHGVLKWDHELSDEVQTIYDIDGLDGAYHNKDPNDRLADVFGVDQRRTLDDVDEPFFFLERDLTTHAPYNQREPTGLDAYMSEVENDWGRIREDYREGVRMSREIFRERLDRLQERGVAEDTLVIFTADHGEILGEYGDIGHSNPVCPEIAFVPTVFMHPSLSADDFHVDPETEIIEQVDVVRTALSMIGFDEIPSDGVDLTSRTRDNPRGYNYVQVEKGGIPFYEAKSAWSYDGGHVFLANPRAIPLGYFLYRQLRSPHRHTIRKNWRSVLRHYVHDTYQYGDPGFSADGAKRFIDAKVDSFDRVEPSEIALSEETERQLKDMGYRT